MTPEVAAALFRTHALELGFAGVAFTTVEPFERHRLFQSWLERGLAGEMRYLETQAEERAEPKRLLENARTLVTVALSYNHPDPPDIPRERLVGGPRGQIARYARGADYHTVLKSKLAQLARRVSAALGRDIAWRSLVDSGPVHEREAAHRAGLGFIAKNTLVILPGVGSYVLLGELVVDVECAPEEAGEPRCGQCRLCLDACPTGAFVDAFTLDARRCISYLTIELMGPIPRPLRPLIGDHIFGCDRCQEVCPFNAGQLKPGAPELAPQAGMGHPALRRLVNIGAAQFRHWQKQSARRRIHRPQLLRNAAVALGNVGSVEDVDALVEALEHKYPLVRAHVVWALRQIAQREPTARPHIASTLEALRARESEREVLEEIDATV